MFAQNSREVPALAPRLKPCFGKMSDRKLTASNRHNCCVPCGRQRCGLAVKRCLGQMPNPFGIPQAMIGV